MFGPGFRYICIVSIGWKRYISFFIQEKMMFRVLGLLVVLGLVGCASTESKDYRPYKSREKKAYARADRSVSFEDVKTNFQAHVETEVAWAGIINDIQFKEMERTIQVAFDIDQRAFDWQKHGDGKSYKLSATSGGNLTAGWTVDKPARISYLQTLAKPGYMIVIYGKPWKRIGDRIQLAATAVRPIKPGNYEILPLIGMSADGEETTAD